ncbi:MAG: T9SS type A sorting domain-containing protein [Chitinophagales bacterium]|nr:T9SS type A sorting domain-containing protein [Chitinophagales bacterium]
MKKFIYGFMLLGCCLATNAQTIKQLSFRPLTSTLEMKYIQNHLVVSQDGLLTFDVSNPNVTPILDAQVPYPGNTAYEVTAEGNLAYMADGNNGIFAVYNISNFNAPVLKGSVAIPATSFYISGDMEPHGNYVYITGVNSLFVMDVTNPSLPKQVNEVAVPNTGFGGAGEIGIDHNNLFVRADLGTNIYDISNPTAPVLISVISNKHANNDGLSTDTLRHRVFLPWLNASQEFIGYDAYDVTNPRAPQFLYADSTFFGSGNFGPSAYSYTNNVVYLASASSVKAFDASAQSHSYLTSFTGVDVSGSIITIDVKDSVFYVAKNNGLEVLKFTPGNVPLCSVTSGLIATNITSTSAVLNWFAVPGAQKYKVKYSEVGSNVETVVKSKDNKKKITGLSPATTYTFRVKTICGNNVKSDYSAPSNFTTAVARLLSEDMISLQVFPNPMVDESAISISLNETTVISLELFNLEGKKVATIANETAIAGPHSYKLDKNSLGSGVYFLKLITPQTQITTKIIIQ